MVWLVEECMEKMEKKLHLTEEEEEGVTIDEGEFVSVESGRLCLIGKITAIRIIGRDVVAETMGVVAWDLRDRFKCKALGDNTFVFQFRSKLDLLKAKNGGPWHVDNNLLVLQQFNGDLRTSEYKFNRAAFWVQVLDPPQKYMSLKCAEVIGNKCGKFIEWDDGNDSIIWGKRLRIRVEIDVCKPLMRGMNLRSSDGRVDWVDFKFEKLPSYCQWCGRLGHRLTECIHKLQDSENGGKGSPPYMCDLKAAVSKRRQFKRSQLPETSQESTTNRVALETWVQSQQKIAIVTAEEGGKVGFDTPENRQVRITPTNLVNVPINLVSPSDMEDIQISNSNFSANREKEENILCLGSQNRDGPGSWQKKKNNSSLGKPNPKNKRPTEASRKVAARKGSKGSIQEVIGPTHGKRKIQQEDCDLIIPDNKKRCFEVDVDCNDICPTVVARQPRREY